MLQETNRIFRDVETGNKFRLYTSLDGSKYHLLSEDNSSLADGCEVNGFYIMMQGGSIRLNNGKEITLNPFQFYNLKEGEKITHTKPPYKNKFSKNY